MRLCSTKQSSKVILSVVVVLLLAGAAVVVYLYEMPAGKSSSTTTAASTAPSGGGGARWFRTNYDNITVGYNSGLWSLSLTDVGGRQVKQLSAILKTPVESKLCTGPFGGFYFSNCSSPTGLAVPVDTPFPANATFSGFASGAGAGSAKLGASYNVLLIAVFADGTAVNDTLTVTAVSG